ncbi:MAG: hypothetical protein AAF959_22655 [Cyanobacteria bacterium P01_D01_bin.56]
MIPLLQSPRLTLVNCQISGGMVRAGWCYTYGLLQSVEQMESDGKVTAIQIPEFMQQDHAGGEMFDANDTIDFLIVI